MTLHQTRDILKIWDVCLSYVSSRFYSLGTRCLVVGMMGVQVPMTLAGGRRWGHASSVYIPGEERPIWPRSRLEAGSYLQQVEGRGLVRQVSRLQRTQKGGQVCEEVETEKVNWKWAPSHPIISCPSDSCMSHLPLTTKGLFWLKNSCL